MVARRLDPDGKQLGKFWKSTLVGRYGQNEPNLDRPT
jgi:hypothetical protein